MPNVDGAAKTAKRVRASNPITGKPYWIAGSHRPEHQALWHRVSTQAKLLKLSPFQLRGVIDSELETASHIVAIDRILRPLGEGILPWGAGWTTMAHQLAGLDASRRVPATTAKRLQDKAESHNHASTFLSRVEPLPEEQQKAVRRAFLDMTVSLVDPSAIVITHSVAFGYADEWFTTFKADTNTGLGPTGHLPGTRRRPTAAEWFMFLKRPPGIWNYIQLDLWKLPRTQQAFADAAKSVPRSTP